MLYISMLLVTTGSHVTHDHVTSMFYFGCEADNEVEVEDEEDYNDNPAQESAELSESGVPQFTSIISLPHNVVSSPTPFISFLTGH